MKENPHKVKIPERESKVEVDPIKYAELPYVTELPKGQRQVATDLLVALDRATGDEAAAKSLGDSIKLTLEKLQAEAELPGLRYENLCFVAREMPGRKTLDKGLLIECGVEPRVIELSMKTGKSYIERRFKNLG